MTLLSNRTKMMLLTGLVCLFAAGTAAAQANPATCVNDIDCAANPACGGDVCDWNTATHVCKAAGSGGATDGWCTTTDDCKCKDLGATCVAAYCTFTRPCGAPDAGGCPASTGTAGTSGGGGGGGGGCSVAATAPTAASALLVAIGLLVFARRRRS